MSSIFGCATSCNNCGDPISTQLNIVIPSGNTVIVDQLSLANFDAVQWNLLITDPSINKRKFQSVFATHENNTTPFHNIFARTGSPKQNFDFQIDVQIVLGSWGTWNPVDSGRSIAEYSLDVTLAQLSGNTFRIRSGYVTAGSNKASNISQTFQEAVSGFIDELGGNVQKGFVITGERLGNNLTAYASFDWKEIY